jgi:hypothetical protein
MVDSTNADKLSSGDSGDYDGQTEVENASYRGKSEAGPENMNADQLRANINAKIANPLAGFSHQELAEKGEAYVKKYQIGDDEDVRAFRMVSILREQFSRFQNVHEL